MFNFDGKNLKSIAVQKEMGMGSTAVQEEEMGMGSTAVQEEMGMGENNHVQRHSESIG